MLHSTKLLIIVITHKSTSKNMSHKRVEGRFEDCVTKYDRGEWLVQTKCDVTEKNF